MSKELAFVIPLDVSRHLEYASNLAALSTPFSDIYVVLTTDEDLAIWNRSPVEGVQVLTLTHWVPTEAIDMVFRTESTVTFKKWMSLRRLLDTRTYKYIIACDSEIAVLKPIDQQFIDDLPSQFIFVGDHRRRQHMRDLDTRTQDLFECKDFKYENCNDIYCWWSGLPIYETSSLNEFLNHVQADKPIELAKILIHDVFDHLIYQRFMYHHKLHGARYVCLTHDMGLSPSRGWGLELAPSCRRAHEAAHKAGVKPLWIHHKFLPFSPDAYIIYHLDRDDEPEITE